MTETDSIKPVFMSVSPSVNMPLEVYLTCK